ncbi:MAG: ATP phosphoribosyltransferase [Verrucomicrobiota bacterium JB022]|nr:ATP phosphoribosyltransferase [Verrucomicrobiota bacterium JB022]
MYKIAVPNKGALSEGAVEILNDAGYRCRRYGRELVVRDAEHEVEFIFLRPRDIAVYVGSGIIHAGITGRDLAMDSRAEVVEKMSLNFGRSRFCYAVPAEKDLTPEQFGGLRVATSYPAVVEDDLKKRGVEAEIVRLDGAVEISIQLGVADVIADVVESGRTLYEAGLKIVGEPIMHSEAVVIAQQGAEEEPELKSLLQRVSGILVARSYVLMTYLVPRDNLEAACKVTPGVKSPTIAPVSEDGWVSVSAMVKSKGINRIIDELEALNAKGVIASAIKTCRL